LVRKLNRARKKQARQIEILCGDFVELHRDLIKRLGRIDFRARFYESICGVTELHQLVTIAAELFRTKISGVNVTFVLRRGDKYEKHIFESGQSNWGSGRLEDCLNDELMHKLCDANGICSLEDLLMMGLQAKPDTLSDISVFVVPFGQRGSAGGFFLLYRPADHPLGSEEVKSAAAVKTGLYRSIQASISSIQSPN